MTFTFKDVCLAVIAICQVVLTWHFVF